MHTIFSTLKVSKSICAYKREKTVSREDINLAISLSMIHKAKKIPEFQQKEKSEGQEQLRDDNESKASKSELNNEDKKYASLYRDGCR